jgi:GMP synthase (glutamine-hydrolysing)
MNSPNSVPLTIGILETGRSREALTATHGGYIDMFRALFAEAAPELSFRVFAILDDQFPDTVTACDGWLITGSRHGVYENLPWMIRLQAFLREAVAAARPVVGICFGHQILAEALGGRVQKSDRGWGIALHHYRLAETPAWMGADGGTASMALNAMHQDQVERLPVDNDSLHTHVLASSEFCPYAALRYARPSDGKDLALSFQAHPEFGTAYEGDLIGVLAGTAIPQEQADAALSTLGQGDAPEQQRIARWIGAFYHQAVAR